MKVGGVGGQNFEWVGAHAASTTEQDLGDYDQFPVNPALANP